MALATGIGVAPIAGIGGSATPEYSRIEEYKTNYFLWTKDFSFPATDSLSERALRGVKSKMKIAGQFFTPVTADYYAIIKSYIETCHRNNINEFDALQRDFQQENHIP